MVKEYTCMFFAPSLLLYSLVLASPLSSEEIVVFFQGETLNKITFTMFLFNELCLIC